MIEIDIEKKLGDKSLGWELRVRTSFHMQAITRIVGPSGVGKTTLLKILAGLVQPDAGNIRFGETLWYDKESAYSKPVQARNIGFVFQEYALFPNMTVTEHLRYGTADTAYIQRLLEIAEMEAYQNRYPKQLSGGQQQRLAILRALSTKPTLLLMDEPFAALDEALKNRIIPRIKQLLQEQSTTVIWVSHQSDLQMGSNQYEFVLHADEN
ncbi:ATP-binding cassette domain-containing protein [Pedobacter sp. MW01-1-1]|uniref:ATP-binding cassette domain-containing protein n=1 Tax=Pedobacter sp. MW01-1-1 TaxID=3383027 RepID=UPI003FF0DCC9